MKKHLTLLASVAVLTATLLSCSGSKQSPDLALYGLKGQVKSVTIVVKDANADKKPLEDRGFTLTLSFDQNGVITEENSCAYTANDITRDDQGRIIGQEWHGVYGDGVEYGESRTYHYAEGLLPDTIVKTDAGEFGLTTTGIPVYNDAGQLSTNHVLQVQDGSEITSDITYEILDIDAQGNWTKRFQTEKATSRWLQEDGTLSQPETETTYLIEERTITYWDAEQKAEPATSSEDTNADADIFAQCYDKNDLQELVYYVVLRDTKAYQSPTSAKPMEDGIDYSKDYKVMAESGAASFTEYDQDWYVWEWRGETYYYRHEDFERKTVQCTSRLATNIIKPGKELWFKAKDGSTITLSILDNDGHAFHPMDEGNADVYGFHVGKDVYIMQFGGEYGAEPYVLNEEKGYVSLCGMGSYISRVEGDCNDCEGVVINGKLTCDAWHVCFPDPDFNYEVYYIPSEKALFLNGDLYHFDKESDL